MNSVWIYIVHRFFYCLGWFLAVSAIISALYTFFSKGEHSKIVLLISVALSIATGICFHFDSPDSQYMNYRSFAIRSIDRCSEELDELNNLKYYPPSKKKEDKFKGYYKVKKIKYLSIISQIDNEKELLSNFSFTDFNRKQQDSYVEYSKYLELELDALNDFKETSSNSQKFKKDDPDYFKEVSTDIQKFKIYDGDNLYFSFFEYQELNERLVELNAQLSDYYQEFQTDYYLSGISESDSSASTNYRQNKLIYNLERSR